MNRPVDHDKDDSSVDDILESIPLPSIAVNGPQGLRLHSLANPITDASYGPMFNNDHMFESTIANNGDCLGAMPNLPLKRMLPSLYWDEKDIMMEPSPVRRSSGTDLGSDSSMGRPTEGNNSGSMISSLLSQFPTAPASTSLLPPPEPGSTGETILRPAYQLPGLDWYA